MNRDHLVVLYLCGRCLWNSAVVCEPREPPPESINCAPCSVTGHNVDAAPIEALLASREECQRLTARCSSLEPEDHKEAFRLLETLRGGPHVVVTEWTRKPDTQPALDVRAFQENVARL